MLSAKNANVASALISEVVVATMMIQQDNGSVPLWVAEKARAFNGLRRLGIPIHGSLEFQGEDFTPDGWALYVKNHSSRGTDYTL